MLIDDVDDFCIPNDCLRFSGAVTESA